MAAAATGLLRARTEQVRARDLMAAGKPTRAAAALGRAFRALPGEPQDDETAEVLARVLITSAHVEYELRGTAAADEALKAAGELIDRHRLDRVRVPLQNQSGLLAVRAGRLADAVRAFDQATPYLADAEVNERCYLLLNRSVAHIDSGRARQARADLEACIAEAGRAELRLVQAMAGHNLGYVDALLGDLPSALHAMDEATRLEPTLSPAVVLQARAEVLIEAGLHREADEALAQASAIFAAERLLRDHAETELDRARCALALGDPATAARHARAARGRFARRGNVGWRRAAELVLLQAELAAGHRGRPLIAAATRLRDELRDEGLRLPARTAALVLVELLLAAGSVAGAAEELAGAGRVRVDDPITGRVLARLVTARVEAATGHPERAAREVRRGLAELAGYQASFGSIDLRTASAVHGRRLAEFGITLARAGGRAPAVFAAVEQARAVSSRLPVIRPPDDPGAAELLAELRQTVDALRPAELDRAASAPLLRRRRELERAITARSWTRSGAGGAIRPAALGDVRARLAGDATMIVYVQADQHLGAVVVGRRVRLCDLGAAGPAIELVRRVRADLDVLAQPRLPPPLRTAAGSALRRSLAALDDALIRPLEADGPLVVVSTGVLGQLPWAALPSLRGRPIVVAPSATKWLQSASPAATSGGRAVAFAGPDLERAAHEATAVGAVWPGAEVVTGGGATTAAFADAVGRACVLHVAAHGVHQPENPLFSFLRMADGPVFAHELDRTPRAPEHVVLSACEVGLATVRPGDEALGLASVLLHLGTRSVVAGVARVGDELAERTMAAYHRRLAGGQDSSVALAEALVEVDADVPPPFVNFGAAWRPDLEAAPRVP